MSYASITYIQLQNYIKILILEDGKRMKKVQDVGTVDADIRVLSAGNPALPKVLSFNPGWTQNKVLDALSTDKKEKKKFFSFPSS